MLMLTHVLQLARLVESGLDGKATCGTKYIQLNRYNLDWEGATRLRYM